MADTLIIYYSRAGQNYVDGQIKDLPKGNARILTDYLEELTGGDVFAVETVEPYPEDYMACTEVAKKEQAANARPALAAMPPALDGYDTVILCGPCWWGSYPMAMFTALESLDFTGKKVLPVMTHEGSGMGNTAKDLRKLCKGAKIAKGLAVQGSAVSRAKGEVAAFLAKNK